MGVGKTIHPSFYVVASARLGSAASMVPFFSYEGCRRRRSNDAPGSVCVGGNGGGSISTMASILSACTGPASSNNFICVGRASGNFGAVGCLGNRSDMVGVFCKACNDSCIEDNS